MSGLSADGKTVRVPPGTLSVGLRTYSYNKTIERVECADNMDEIGYESFRGCTALKSIALKPGLKKIGCRTFGGCTQLTHVSFVDGMDEIGYESFRGCTALKSIALKPGLKEIPYLPSRRISLKCDFCIIYISMQFPKFEVAAPPFLPILSPCSKRSLYARSEIFCAASMPRMAFVMASRFFS